MPRLFIAIGFEDNLRKQLAGLQAELKQAQADVRWVASENIHLTLRFIGEVSEEAVPSIKDILKKTIENYRAFEIELKGVGAFPSVNNPRVIWIGCQDPTGQLFRIYQDIERSLIKLGLPGDDHKFSPHITLGRTKSTKNRDKLIKLIKLKQDYKVGRQKVKEITLFQSQLQPTGPIYTVLEQVTLK